MVGTVDSTNARLLAAVTAHPDDYPHLSVIVSRDQRAGRGRLDREWVAAPGSGLAISTVLRVSAVAIDARGWIPLIAGEAMAHAAAQQTRGSVGVKWPNDVLVDGRKISGILVEVAPEDPFAVVVGAGVNTAMTTEQLPVPTATSFAVRGESVDEDRLLADYLDRLRDGIAALAVGDSTAAGIRNRVRAACVTLGERVRVELRAPGAPAPEAREGVATAIDDAGHLLVETDGATTAIAAGDVVHLRATPGAS